jgi:hypothetical protein
MSTEGMKQQFALWRLFATIGCFACAAGLLRFTFWMVDGYGGGFFPVLCAITAVCLVIGGVAFLFPKVASAIVRIIVEVVEFFFPFP